MNEFEDDIHNPSSSAPSLDNVVVDEWGCIAHFSERLHFQIKDELLVDDSCHKERGAMEDQ